MIEFKRGDILNTNCEALVNPVNCVGVAGAGLALKFKESFPDNFHAYVLACKDGLQPGHVNIYDRGVWGENPRWIINFPTKNDWRDPSRMSYIESGLDVLKFVIVDKKIRSIAIPALGCGLGGLVWDEVKPLIMSRLDGLSDVKIFVYEPGK